MRPTYWVGAVAAFAMAVVGGMAGQACSSSSTPVAHNPTPDAGVDTGQPSGTDGGSDGAVVVPPWRPGDGGPCTGPVGGFPSPTCDPSDEQAPGCQGGLDSGCTISSKCGSAASTSCEPFVTNPPMSSDGGVQNFRMRLINVTAPPQLATQEVQEIVVTSAVDIPPSSGCGESGTGYWNWLFTVDKAKGTVETGGAPPSTDPIGTGYCYLNGTLGSTKVAPLTLDATWSGNTFSTKPTTATLEFPVFVAGKPSPGVVIFPISEPAFHEVTISEDGNCVGTINANASYVVSSVCEDPEPLGTSTCSRWHSNGTLAGYIKLATADRVLVAQLEESLCVLLLGSGASDNGSPVAKCVPSAYTQGNYNSTTHQPCGGGSGCDSSWLSMQFAASAVKISSEPSVSLCNGGSMTVQGT